MIDELYRISSALRRPCPDRDRPVHGRPGRLHCERRAGRAQELARILGERPAVGDHLVRDRLRRLPAARWTDRRPLRPPAHVRGRRRCLRHRLGPVRPRLVIGLADRVPRPRGLRRRAVRAGRPVAPDDRVPRGERAQPRDRRLGRSVRIGRRRRRPARRAARLLHQLAVDLPDQRAGRPRRDRTRSALSRRGEAARCRPPLRRCRCGDGHLVADAVRLRTDLREPARVGLGRDVDRARGVGRAARRVHRDRAAAPRRR